MRTPNDSPEDDRHRPARRPYEPPRVEESAQFETLALGCDKVPGVTGTFECELNGTQS